MPTKPKLKVAKSQADEPPLVFAMPENPPSALSDRVAVRLEGITFLMAPGQADGFRVRHGQDDLAPDGLDKP